MTGIWNKRRKISPINEKTLALSPRNNPVKMPSAKPRKICVERLVLSFARGFCIVDNSSAVDSVTQFYPALEHKT